MALTKDGRPIIPFEGVLDQLARAGLYVRESLPGLNALTNGKCPGGMLSPDLANAVSHLWDAARKVEDVARVDLERLHEEGGQT
ncbi:MAG: hypothetical protein ABSA21_08405 [Candidatus Limnocylindrales bacterium]|jgi:hypothetical protein